VRMHTGVCVVFFFQAEDGIRDDLVTGVQTCALPIYVCILDLLSWPFPILGVTISVGDFDGGPWHARVLTIVGGGRDAWSVWRREIGRASCRERVGGGGGGGWSWREAGSMT